MKEVRRSVYEHRSFLMKTCRSDDKDESCLLKPVGYRISTNLVVKKSLGRMISTNFDFLKLLKLPAEIPQVG